MKKRTENIIVTTTLIVCFIIMAIIFIYPIVYEKICISRVYSDLEEQLNNDVCSANVRIFTRISETNENVVNKYFSESGCGVVFDLKDGCYYVLTAAHVVDGSSEINTASDISEDAVREYLIASYNTPTFKSLREDSENAVSAEQYCEKLPLAEVVYIAEDCDIAILKFKSDNENTDIGVSDLNSDFNCLSIAKEDPARGQRVVVFGKTDTGSKVTYGKIISKEYENFDALDGRRADKCMYHNSYVVPGFSGGAVLNDKMEIVGVNIGGGTDVLGRFKYGAMIPAELINEVLIEWNGM